MLYSQYIDQSFISGKERTQGTEKVLRKGKKWTMQSTLPPGLGVALAGDCCPLNFPLTLHRRRRRPPATRASLPLWPWDPPDCPAASTSPPGVCPETQIKDASE